MPQALEGIRVLDFTRVLAGPYCTMMLADLGADVVKVERPKLGDDTRHWGPPWLGDYSAYFLCVNRNKRSLTLDLKSLEGQALARDLAAKSDVLVENFKVGQMADFGLDFESLRAINPRLVYCSITGYGQNSPYKDRPGYDVVIQGQSGLMSITGPSEGMPHKVGVAISDVITGLTAANAIQAALIHQLRTGEGQYIDTALLDSQIAAMVNIASNYLVSCETPARYGNAHASIVPYEVFAASDGYFILGVGNDRQFRALCEIIAHPEWAKDEKFATNPARVQHRNNLVSQLGEIFAEKTRDEWLADFQAAKIPAGKINSVAEALESPHADARELVQEITLENEEVLRMVASPLNLSATPTTIRRPPPKLGADTEAVLGEWLEHSAEAVRAYRENGIV